MVEVVALGELLIDFTLQHTDPAGYPVILQDIVSDDSKCKDPVMDC